MSAFHRYTDYKPTGVSWIESIPAHWEMKKINDLFSERSEKCSDKDFMPLSVTKFGVTKQLDTAVKSKDSDNRKKVLKGDFVINSRSDRRGSSGFSEYDGSVSTELQGLEEDIDKIVQALYNDRYIEIDDFRRKRIPLDEEERRFGIRY